MEDPGFFEPFELRDTFVEGLAAIDLFGQECVRLKLFASHTDEIAPFKRKMIVSKLIYPRSVAFTINGQMRAFLAGTPFMSGDVEICMRN